MWRRRNITHPRVMHCRNADLTALVRGVEQGDPGSLIDTPTSLVADELLAAKLSAAGVDHLRQWMRSGQTSTLRVNALSVLARCSDRADAQDIIDVLESDGRVRVVSVASAVSRLMQYDWQTCVNIARNPKTAADPVTLAKRLAKDATDVHHAEARWYGEYLLKELTPYLVR